MVVSLTLTVKQGKSVKVQSVWRVAGVHHHDHDNHDYDHHHHHNPDAIGVNNNATKILRYIIPTNKGRTQLVLGGTQNASQEWRAASFAKTYNVLKVFLQCA